MKPVDVRVANLRDEDLDLIVALRKKIKKPKEREGYVRGLYYISVVDNDYSKEEQDLVEGVACALGINENSLADIKDSVKQNPKAIQTFANLGNKGYRERLFEEMGALTYLKGYQLTAEDKALSSVAKEMGLDPEKAERTLLNLYMESQGMSSSGALKSTGAKVALGAGAIVVGAVICAATAGAAAPAIGAAVGGLGGLSGAAATSAGLAALGGGAIAAGGGGVAVGTTAVIAVGAAVGGGSAAVALSVKANIANAGDKKKLQAAIKKQQKERMTKQEIVDNLIKAINMQKQRLAVLEEKSACKRDIASTTLAIANLEAQKYEIEADTASGQ